MALCMVIIKVGAGVCAAPPEMPPQLRHYYLETSKRDRVDAVRRCIFALDLQKVLIFMNYQQRLKARHIFSLMHGPLAYISWTCGRTSFA